MILTKIINNNTITMNYPFDKTTFSNVEFSQPLTFITGDNGSGKSTLLKIIQELSGLRTISSKKCFDEDTGLKILQNYKLVFTQQHIEVSICKVRTLLDILIGLKHNVIIMINNYIN